MAMRKLCRILTTLTLFSAPVSVGLVAAPGSSHAAAATKPAKPKPIKVKAIDKADLRAETSDISKVLKRLKKGEKIDYVGRSGDGKWIQVRKGKIEGWVSAAALTDVPPAEATAVAQTGTSPTATPTPTPTATPTPTETKPPPTASSSQPDFSTSKPAQTASTTPSGSASTGSPSAQVEPAKDPAGSTAQTGLTAQANPPVETKPAATSPVQEPDAEPPKKPATDGLRGFFLSIGAGAALANSSITAGTSSGLSPELFNYSIDNLLAVGAQARLGYTFGWKWLRVGVDAGYRFGGAAQIVIQLPDRDSIPMTGQGGAATSVFLKTARQELATMTHDADAGLSVGGYFGLGKKLEMSLRARGGFQFFGFIPELNALTPLPQELFYGPSVGGLLDLQTRAAPGFGLRAEGGYIPWALRQQNPGLRDGEQKKTTGFYVGGGASVRILPGFEIEATYRLLSTSTEYQEGSVPERLLRDRDPEIQRRARSGTETLTSGLRQTGQHTFNLNLVFFRR